MNCETVIIGSRQVLKRPAVTALIILVFSLSACGENFLDPWAEPPAPPLSIYNGPLFELSHQYPQDPVAPPVSPPWQTAINSGEITTSNASAYTNALKDFIAEDMKQLLFDYQNWDAPTAGWYNLPWLTELDENNQPMVNKLREPIHGTYVGSTFPPEMFPKSELSNTMSTHVLVYYDAVAASSLQRVWGESGMDPLSGLEANGGQFPEGGIIVKSAFTTASGHEWPPIAGAYPWQIYAPLAQNDDGSDNSPPSQLQTVYLFQFDIIVKDTKSAPDSGWVFTTLVYDQRVESEDPWDKMIPLGTMWGNDPDVISPQACDYLVVNDCPELSETWINQGSPVYSRETLGWGGRLSGPNDGAVDINAYVQNLDKSIAPVPGRYAMSSCMSCHSSAQYPMESFLLPVPSSCNAESCKPATVDLNGNTSLVYYPSGSDQYMRWFQSNPGTHPMDSGTTPLDYNMNEAFKALPQWYKQTGQTGTLNFIEAFNAYHGLSPDH